MKPFRALCAFVGLFALTSSSAHALNPAESALIEAAVKTVMQTQVGRSSTNFSELIRSIDCQSVSCSQQAVCSYLNVGSYFPMDCSQYPDTAVHVNKEELAIQLLLNALPEPESCKTAATTTRPGSLIIGGFPPILEQCMNERQKQRATILENRDEIVRLYGLG